MFLMIGISDGTKEFEFTQTMICGCCGRYGRFMVFMTYTVLSLFFIPCFKWNKQYFVKTSCCGKVYKLNPDVGKRIAKGEDVEIRQEDLEEMPAAYGYGNTSHWAGWRNEVKTCSHCGYSTDEDFDYCPKCGNKL